MTNTMTRLCAGAALTGAVLLASGVAQTASAQTRYDYYGRPYHTRQQAVRPLTVAPHYARPALVAPTYSPYDGPQTVITAPIAAASTLVALPFRVVNGVFPPNAPDPRVIVGAPVYAAGQVAQLPFRALQAPFGGWDYQPD